MKNTPLLVLVTGCLLMQPSFAVDLTGNVTDTNGQPVSGVMVSIDNGDVQPGDVTISVFTDAQGGYQASGLSSVEGMKVRATLAGYANVEPDSRESVLAAPVDGHVEQNFVMQVGMDADALPASVWMDKMPAGHGRELTLLQCGSCHQVPSKKMRGFAQNLAGLSEQDRINSWKSMM